MKQRQFLSLLLALLLTVSIGAVTPAFAATTTSATVAAETADPSATAAENTEPQKKSLGKQFLILLAFAAGVGVLAALYGLINMHYNADKMAEMTEESRKIIEKMNDRES